MRAVVFTGAGGNEVVDVVERPDPLPRSEQVVVRVRYAGLNPADIAQRMGHYPAPPGSPPDVPGLEVAGVVEQVGDGVLALAPGDRVFGLVGGGGLADRVAAHERHLVRLPDALDERDGAAIPEAFVTAHDAARSQAGLAPGETLLVQGAAGGVGAAAVQIGRALGARVLAVVRSPEAAAFVRELGAEPIDDDGFERQVREATGGRGVDVVLELVGGIHLAGDLEAIAPLGRIVIVSTAAGAEATLSLRRLMGTRASVRGTMLRARSLEDKALAVRAFEREVVPLLSDGRLRATIDSVFEASRAAQAFERLAGRGKRGKVLLEFG
jgi:putative PIG3 family NAD(P)H quinone oxidoreductase